MTINEMQAEISRLTAENAKLRGETIKAARPSKRTPKVIRVENAYADSHTYTVNASITPKSGIVLTGNRPNYDILDETRGKGRHKITPFTARFEIGDPAIYGGFNFCYWGDIVSIGAKTVTIEERHSGTRHRLSISKFAFWNRQDARFAHDERNSWSD